MSNSAFLSRCSSYEGDVDSDSEIFTSSSSCSSYTESEEEEMDNGFVGETMKETKKSEKKKKSNVLLEGYVVDDLKRTKSLTDDDLEELKGCVDLGFGFNYEEIPELCNTLPALELCYSMSQKFMDQDLSPEKKPPMMLESHVSPIASWKISSPGKPYFSNVLIYSFLLHFQDLLIIMKNQGTTLMMWKQGWSFGHKLWHALWGYALEKMKIWIWSNQSFNGSKKMMNKTIAAGVISLYMLFCSSF